MNSKISINQQMYLYLQFPAKISIIIPVHSTEETDLVISTLTGIDKTIGLPVNEYTVTLIGTLPGSFFQSADIKQIKSNWNFIPSTFSLGDAENHGAKYALTQYHPDVLVFMDSHMIFYNDLSVAWGVVLYDFLKTHPDAIISPAINWAGTRVYGIMTNIVEDSTVFNMVMQWVGAPNSNNDPFEVPALAGCFMSMNSKTFSDSIVGFTPPQGCDDREFSMRMWLLGKTIYSIPKLTVGHVVQFRPLHNTPDRRTEWGTGSLLFTYLDMNEDLTMRLYEKGLDPTSDKAESLRLATTPYWKQVRHILKSKFVRTPEQYFKCFSNQ